MNSDRLKGYETYLRQEEKSENTISKYIRDVRKFLDHLCGREITRETVIDWKRSLIAADYKPRSINSMLAAVNSFLKYLDIPDACVRNMRIQKHAYRQDSDELTREEYFRLVDAAESKPRLQLILQTLGSTGIRVSELGSFTVEAVEAGEVMISCKNKIREILIPDRLRKLLLEYAEDNGIEHGPILQTHAGNSVNRSNVWAGMKSLCGKAGVDPQKVYPHNFRKLFAREFYALDKDIAKLADVLGHSNIETTRIYIMGSGKEHKAQIDRLALTR